MSHSNDRSVHHAEPAGAAPAADDESGVVAEEEVLGMLAQLEKKLADMRGGGKGATATQAAAGDASGPAAPQPRAAAAPASGRAGGALPSWLQQGGAASPAGAGKPQTAQPAAPAPAAAQTAKPAQGAKPPAPAAPAPAQRAADAGAAAAELARRDAELSQRQAELQRREAQFQTRLEALEADLRRRSESASAGDTADAGALEAAERRVGEVEAELKRLRDDLSVKERQVDFATRQIESLQQELEKAEAVDPAEVDTLRTQVERLKTALAQRDEKIDEYQKKIEQMTSAATGGSAADPIIEIQRRQIERLTAQLESSRAESNPEEIRRRDTRIAELEQALAAAAAAAPAGEGGGGVGKVVGGFVEALTGGKGKSDDEQVLKLEAERERYRRAAERAIAEAEEARNRLAEMAGRAPEGSAAEATRALEERIKELERDLREAQAEAKSARTEKAQLRLDEAQGTRDLKARIVEAQEALRKTEQLMVRRWARQRAVVVLGWLALVACICAAVSTVAAFRYFPAVIFASIEIGAKTSDAAPLSPAAAADWARWHTEVLGREAFHTVLARRMAERRLDRFDDAEAVGRKLEDDLSVLVGKPGQITLTLAGTDMDETVAALGVVASTLAAESSQQVQMRPDGAPAVLRGDVLPGDFPLRDRRLIAGAGIFAITMLLSVIAVLRLHRWLMKSGRVLDEAGVFFDPDGLRGRARPRPG